MSSDEGDAAIARLDAPLDRVMPFTARHLARVTRLGGPNYPPGLVRTLAIQAGTPPAVTQDNFEFFLREPIVVALSEDEALLWVTLAGGGLTEFWTGTTWSSTSAAFGAFRTDDLEVEIDSDGISVVVRVYDAAGTLVTETSPRGWAELAIAPPNQPTTLHAFWGEPFAGPGAVYFFADFSSDFALVRHGVVYEPTVSVVAR